MKIPPTRKKMIYDYLADSGCSPSLSGFKILADVISLAADKPSLNCKQLFEEYAVMGSDIPYMSSGQAYKNARYCYVKTPNATLGVYEFIKKCSVSLEDITE